MNAADEARFAALDAEVGVLALELDAALMRIEALERRNEAFDGWAEEYLAMMEGREAAR